MIAIRQTSARYRTIRADGEEAEAGDVATLAKAILRATELGASVINVSLVSCVSTQAAARSGPTLQAAVHEAVARDVVIVAAAGNTPSPGCPSRADADALVLPAWFDDDVLTVASAGADGTVSPFSIRAPWVDVAAPGERLVSLSSSGSGLTDRFADAPIQGTSFAAPAVAGLAALIRAEYPELSAHQVMDRITATARREGGGRNWASGWGMIDPEAALTRRPTVLPPPAATAGPTAGGSRLWVPEGTPEPNPAPALWGGVLALTAAAAAGMLAVLRTRSPARRTTGHR